MNLQKCNNYIIIMLQNSQQKSSALRLQGYSPKIENPFKILRVYLKKTPKYVRFGDWTDKEKLKYSIFLAYLQKMLEDGPKRSRFKIFDMMSDALITRSKNQCKYYHNKMLKSHGSITNIITAVSLKYEPRSFTQETERYFAFIKPVIQNQERYMRSTNKSRRLTEVNQKYATLPRVQLIIYENFFQPTYYLQSNQQSLLKNNDGGTEQLNKTRAETYESYNFHEKDETDEVPCMQILQSNLENYNDSHESQIDSPSRFKHPPYISDLSNNRKLSKSEKNKLKKEERRIILLRQLHTMNLHRLSLELIKEKQSIKYYESAIKLLKMALQDPESNS